jgi:hypothetical protein
MKNMLILVALGAAFTLSACGKSDLEKLNEESAAMSKKTGGSSADIPRVRITPDKKKEGGK